VIGFFYGVNMVSTNGLKGFSFIVLYYFIE